MQNRHLILSGALLLLLIVEVLCQNHWLMLLPDVEITYFYEVTYYYFIAGLLICLLPLIRIKPYQPVYSKMAFYATLLGFAAICGFTYFFVNDIFLKWPLDYRSADMLPVISVMGERFVNGQPVYAEIPEIWGGMQPIYLPAMWIPYIPAIISGMDIRWVNVAFILAGIGGVFFMSDGKRSRTVASLLIFIPLIILIRGYLIIDDRMLGLTEEGIVFGYYMFLAYALYTKKTLLIGLAVTFCLLSRFSLMIWAVMLLVFIFIYVSKKQSIRLIITIGILVLALMLSTQALFHLDIFIGLQGTYLNAVTDPANHWKYLNEINNSLGFAKFYNNGDLALLNSIFKWAFVLVPVLSLLAFHFFKNRINRDFFLLCSLKLALVFFYNFLIIPYLYLFYTSTFISIAILYLYFNKNFQLSGIKPIKN